MHKQQFVVIGLGVFGETVATELTRLGHDVLGIDIDERVVDRLAESITHAVVADVINEDAMEELNIGDYDVGVVAIGSNIEAAILGTMQLRALGVEKVWVKALNSQHRRILGRLGATRVIGPEFEMGMRIAQELNYPMVHDYIDLGDGQFIVEVIASEKLQDCSMQKLKDDTQARVHVVAIKRDRDSHMNPDLNFQLREGDQIVLEGQLDELRKLAKWT